MPKKRKKNKEREKQEERRTVREENKEKGQQGKSRAGKEENKKREEQRKRRTRKEKQVYWNIRRQNNRSSACASALQHVRRFFGHDGNLSFGDTVVVVGR